MLLRRADDARAPLDINQERPRLASPGAADVGKMTRWRTAERRSAAAAGGARTALAPHPFLLQR